MARKMALNRHARDDQAALAPVRGNTMSRLSSLLGNIVGATFIQQDEIKNKGKKGWKWDPTQKSKKGKKGKLVKADKGGNGDE